MAKVEMDLAELDLLRESKKDLERQVEAEKKVQEDLRITMEEVKADKKVIEKHSILIDSQLPLDSENIIVGCLARHSVWINKEYSPYNVYNIMAKSIKQKLLEAPSVQGKAKETVIYRNMEDVKEELRAQMDQQTRDTLARLKRENADFEQKLADEKAQHQANVDTITKNHRKVMDTMNDQRAEMIESYEKQRVDTLKYTTQQYELLQMQYDDLKHDRETLTREQDLLNQIERLKAALQWDRNRTLWQRLLGTGKFEPSQVKTL